VIGDEAVDGGLKIDDALEDAAFEATLGEDGEEALPKDSYLVWDITNT
jgi:hypothetical protein